MVWTVQPASAIDTMLDRTIALGYGDIGLQVRRHLPGWPPDPPRMDGKVVVVTGAASGIGLAACLGFAALGASVRAVARDELRAEEAVRQIREAVPAADAQGLGCDVASLRNLRALAERLGAEDHVDVLVNNAGTMPDQRVRSADGHELMFATHVLAPFALTRWLAEVLARSAPSRIINVSSGGMYGQRLPTEDFQSDAIRYSPKKLYARTKREQVVITEMWAEELAPRGVVVHAMHPGWVDTKGVREWLPVFRALTGPIIRTPEAGADTIVWLGGAPEALRTTGGFWHDRRARPTHYLLGAGEDDLKDRRRLWDVCSALIEG
ncbi:MAG TPA: SDR family NAD(P)-dependent oxidoreductase [Solirubrobacteraceae bacterium]|nr:SDR family NAD(P)-dependent oxidoreductase [Solirubrobacteraceae bacterium]